MDAREGFEGWAIVELWELRRLPAHGDDEDRPY